MYINIYYVQYNQLLHKSNNNNRIVKEWRKKIPKKRLNIVYHGRWT